MEENRIQLSPERLRPLLYGDLTFKSAQDFSLTKEDLQKAYLELHESEDGRATAMKKLKGKIGSDQKINYRQDDSYLLRYLRYTKFNVEKAFKIMRRFYVFREENPHVFSLSQMEELLDTNFSTYLPYMDEEKCIVFWNDFRNWNIDDWSIWQMASLFHVMADMASLNPNAQINGIKGVYDLRGLSRRHASLIFNPATIVFLGKMLEDMYPLRVKKIVVIHSNRLLRVAYNTVRHLLKKKIRDRVVFLGSDTSEFHKYFNPAILPKEHGGSLRKEECQLTRKTIMENMNYLKYERSFGPV